MDTDTGGQGSEAQRTTLLHWTPPSQPALVVPCNLLVLVVTAESQHNRVFLLFLYMASSIIIFYLAVTYAIVLLI